MQGLLRQKSQVETRMLSSPSTTSSETTGCCTSAGDATSYPAGKMRTGVGGADVSSSLGTAKRFRPGKKGEKRSVFLMNEQRRG